MQFSFVFQIDILLDRSREPGGGRGRGDSGVSVSDGGGGGGGGGGGDRDDDENETEEEEDDDDDDHARFSLIAKLLPSEDANRGYVFEANLLEKEIEMYFEVLPSMLAFLRSQRSSGNLRRFFQRAIPECIYGTHNTDGAGALVFRSVGDWGFQHCGDPADGLTPAELELAARTLGAIHATGRVFMAKNGADRVRTRSGIPEVASDYIRL